MWGGQASNNSTPAAPLPATPLPLYVPDCEEIRVSAAVARKGYLNVLQHKTHGWKKRWVVSYLSGQQSSDLSFDYTLMIYFL